MAIQLSGLLSPDRVICDNKSLSKTAALSKICQLFKASLCQIDEKELFDSYLNRERLGSTAIGHGIAIPHIKYGKIDTPIACLTKLAKPIEFGAQDQKPVDILIALLAPNDQQQQHLNLLANIAQLFGCDLYRKRLRAANTDQELYHSLYSYEAQLTA